MMRVLKTLTASFLLLFSFTVISACGEEGKDKEDPPPSPPQQEPQPPQETPPSCPPLPIPPLPPFPNPLPPFPVPGPTPSPQPDPDAVKSLLQEVNAARKSRGLSEVSVDLKLGCAADLHAKDIGPKKICGHTGSDGSSPWQRASYCGTSATGEIVACGQGSPKAAVDAWTLSPGHAAIMYDASQKAMGGGMVGNYWVVIFRK